MKKREANFQEVFGQYIQRKKMYGNYELKQTTSNSLSFNDTRLLRQLNSLLAAENEGYYWKHSDADMREKPFDCSFVPPSPGYMVIKYPGFFCMIEAKVFFKETQESKRKSLTSERAEELALWIVKL